MFWQVKQTNAEVMNVWGGECLGWWMSGWWTSYNLFGVNFILQKFCPCKKNDKYQVWWRPPCPIVHIFLNVAMGHQQLGRPSPTCTLYYIFWRQCFNVLDEERDVFATPGGKIHSLHDHCYSLHVFESNTLFELHWVDCIRRTWLVLVMSTITRSSRGLKDLIKFRKA